MIRFLNLTAAAVFLTMMQSASASVIINSTTASDYVPSKGEVVSFESTVTVDTGNFGDRDVFTYTWDFGDGNTASGLSATHSFSAAKNYVVTFVGSDFYNRATTELLIQVQPTVAAAAPEPSTWAMMLLGFAGVGFMAYRKRQSVNFA